MANVRVKFLRPLNGEPVGTEATYSKADADRLAETGAVKILGAAKDDDDAASADARETKMDPAPANKATAVTTRGAAGATTTRRAKRK